MPGHGEVRRAHQMLNAALGLPKRRPTVRCSIVQVHDVQIRHVLHHH